MNARLLRPLASGFNPKTIANLGLWLDASADSSLTFNASTVSEWRDVSGNGRHFAQDTGASQPGTSTLNGKRVLSTTGSQLMTGNAASLGILRNVPGATIVYVGSITVADAQNVIHISNGTNAAQARALMGRIGSFVVAGRRLDADLFASVGQLSGGIASGVYTGVLDYANSDAFLFGDGAQLASSTSFQTDGNTSDTDSLGTSLFATPAGANFCTATLGEVLIWPRVLTAAERQRVERYLGRKWGITVA
jgi:hypothetical protein